MRGFMPKAVRMKSVRWMAATALAGVPLHAAPALAQAGSDQAAAYDFSIPAQPLARSLAAISAVTGVEVIYTDAAPLDVQAPAVQGRMTVDQALNTALSGTGYSWRFTRPGVVTLQRLQSGAAEGERVLGPVRVEGAEIATGGAGAQYGPGKGNELGYRNPTTEGTGSYTTGGVTVAGKAPLSIREVPNSVSVVTRTYVEDRSLQSVQDALLETPGVVILPQNGDLSSVSVRGYSLGADNLQVNGVPARSISSQADFTGSSLLLYDRIEVRKGADGLLQGSGSPGGTVNLVRRKPSDSFGLTASSTVARWNNYQADMVVTGPITSGKGIRALAIGSIQDRNFYYKFQNQRAYLLSGSVEADVTDHILVRFSLDYEDQYFRGFLTGLPTYTDFTQIGLPRDSFLHARSTYYDETALSAYLDVEAELGRDWRLRASAYSRDSKLEYVLSRLRGTGIDRSAGSAASAQLAWSKTRDLELARGVDINLTGTFSTGGIKHELLAGGNYGDVDWESTSVGVNVTDSIPIFGFDPKTQSPPPPTFILPPTRVVDREDYGAYASIRTKWTSFLTTVAGLRWARYKRLTASDEDFIPFAGVIVDVSSNWSVYGSYSEIFASQATRLDSTEQPLPPTVGSQAEAGIKGEFYGGALNFSAALFRILENNRGIPDPSVPAPLPVRYLADGQYRSQGFEVELTGQLTKGLRLIAGYTFNDLKITVNKDRNGNPLSEGLTFNSRVPRHLFKGWIDYTFDETLEGLSLGIGVNAQSSIASGIEAQAIREGSRAIANGRLSYKISNNFDIQLNVQNIFDRKYYAMIGSSAGGNIYGTPREWKATLRLRM